jgi:hypothetical protein
LKITGARIVDVVLEERAGSVASAPGCGEGPYSETNGAAASEQAIDLVKLRREGFFAELCCFISILLVV